jgi:hypothetical protein
MVLLDVETAKPSSAASPEALLIDDSNQKSATLRDSNDNATGARFVCLRRYLRQEALPIHRSLIRHGNRNELPGRNSPPGFLIDRLNNYSLVGQPKKWL